MMLENKTALVTGGSGAVGRAIVQAMAAEGCQVLFTYNSDTESADELCKEMSDKDLNVTAYQLDVTDPPAVTELAKTVEANHGPVEILVNNAGAAQVLPFAMIEEEDWDRIIDVNVKGMFLVTKAFARGMIRKKRGAIVNIGSLAGMRMLEVPVHYATAKSAVVGFTMSLARELGRYQVRVNAVAPGMLTDGVSVNVPEKQRDEYERYCALSRQGSPDEVGHLVAFLASDRAGYINGQTIMVDGGI